MKTIYYDKSNGYICNRYPSDIEVTSNSGSIEVSDEIYEQTMGVEYGKIWAVVDGKPKVIDYKEITESLEYKTKLINDEIYSLKRYLSDTDYIVSKINEASVLNEDVESLKQNYSEQLSKRKEYRAKINELEAQLKELENSSSKEAIN